jgi:pimeloyl-ACP methyl ester carboxylesterase
MKKENFNSYCKIIRNKDSKKDVIFLHGFTSNMNQQNIIADSFAKNNPDYDIIQCDARGHGQRKDGNMLDWSGTVEDIDSIIKSRKRPTTLIGHSMGGTMALTLGLKNKNVKKVFAVSAAHGDKEFIINKIEFYEHRFNVPKEYVDKKKKLVIKSLPAPLEQCKKENKSKFYLIHSKQDGTVPFSEFEKNKKDLCIPEENTLIFDDKTDLKIGDRLDISHIHPFYNPKTKTFIENKLEE